MRKALLLVLLMPVAASAKPRQYSTAVTYEGTLILDSKNQPSVLEYDEIKSFDCSQLVGGDGFVTFIDGRVKIDAKGGYQMDFNQTRVFGRSTKGTQQETKGADVSHPDDEPDCKGKGCPHEHLLGKFSQGQNCRNELQLPRIPAHGSQKTTGGEGSSFIAMLTGGGQEAQRAQLVIGLAIHQNMAPESSDFSTLDEAGKDRLTKGFVDRCFVEKLFNYHFDRKKDGDGLAALQGDCRGLREQEKAEEAAGNSWFGKKKK